MHLAAKYVFVRILRGSRHLQSNTIVHWGTWFAAVWVMAALGFIFSSGIPVFGWVGAISGAVTFSPLSLALPAYLWIHDHGDHRRGAMRQKIFYYLHWLLLALGCFMCIGGLYAISDQIKQAYAGGTGYGKFN
jgi:hypothetical protein